MAAEGLGQPFDDHLDAHLTSRRRRSPSRSERTETTIRSTVKLARVGVPDIPVKVADLSRWDGREPSPELGLAERERNGVARPRNGEVDQHRRQLAVLEKTDRVTARQLPALEDVEALLALHRHYDRR